MQRWCSTVPLEVSAQESRNGGFCIRWVFDGSTLMWLKNPLGCTQSFKRVGKPWQILGRCCCCCCRLGDPRQSPSLRTTVCRATFIVAVSGGVLRCYDPFLSMGGQDFARNTLDLQPCRKYTGRWDIFMVVNYWIWWVVGFICVCAPHLGQLGDFTCLSFGVMHHCWWHTQLSELLCHVTKPMHSRTVGTIDEIQQNPIKNLQHHKHMFSRNVSWQFSPEATYPQTPFAYWPLAHCFFQKDNASHSCSKLRSPFKEINVSV